MSGEDWRSASDRKRQVRAEAARKKAALACAKSLNKAADDLNAYMRTCNDCEDASAVRGADDGRVLLVANMAEYAGYLTERFS